jgi:hypothetical protein
MQSTNHEPREKDDTVESNSSTPEPQEIQVSQNQAVSAEHKTTEQKTANPQHFTFPQTVVTLRELADMEIKDPIPKALITALEAKYSSHFRQALAAKNASQTIVIRFPGSIRNRNGVLLQSPNICFDRTAKLYTIASMPSMYGDPLSGDHCSYEFRICVHCKKLKTALIRFIRLSNKISFCKHCGEYVWSTNWDDTKDMCSKCIMEECLWFSSSISHLCTICQQSGKRMYKTRCAHHFHRKCLSDYLLANMNHHPCRCPNCRTILDAEDESLVDDE